MRKFSILSVLAAMLWIMSIGAADACYCGIARMRCQKPCCCQVTCEMQYCTVMKTCLQTVYEEKECTFYKTVYEDQPEQKTVPTTKFVEGVAYRCAPFTGGGTSLGTCLRLPGRLWPGPSSTCWQPA